MHAKGRKSLTVTWSVSCALHRGHSAQLSMQLSKSTLASVFIVANEPGSWCIESGKPFRLPVQVLRVEIEFERCLEVVVVVF